MRLTSTEERTSAEAASGRRPHRVPSSRLSGREGVTELSDWPFNKMLDMLVRKPIRFNHNKQAQRNEAKRRKLAEHGLHNGPELLSRGPANERWNSQTARFVFFPLIFE